MGKGQLVNHRDNLYRFLVFLELTPKDSRGQNMIFYVFKRKKKTHELVHLPHHTDTNTKKGISGNFKIFFSRGREQYCV